MTKRAVSGALVAMLFGVAPLLAGALYTLDASWKPAFPAGSHSFSGVAPCTAHCGDPDDPLVLVTQRGNTTLDPIIAVSQRTGEFRYSFGKKDVAVAAGPAPSWGAHGIGVVANDGYGAHGVRVYINDFNKFTLTAFDRVAPDFEPRVALTVGTPGAAGVGTDPLQFGSDADTAIAWDAGASPRRVFVSDGDGGDANRVVGLEVSDGAEGAPPTSKLLWATPSRYNNPHSIAYHERTGLLMIADRQQNQTRLIRAADGVDMGEFDCGLTYGNGAGLPFGVRFYRHSDALDLAFVGSMDGGYIAVLDVSGLRAAGAAASSCKVLQTIKTPAAYSGPHLLGVDAANGDLYTATVSDAPKSWVLRYKFSSP